MSVISIIWANLQTLIPDLNTSNAGIIRKIVETVGAVMDIIRLEMLRSQQVIEEGTRAARITTEAFYIEKAYYYQEGHDLVVINEATQEIGYVQDDPNAQIIKQAVIGETSVGVFYLNVATTDANNNIIPLTQTQLDAFRAYYPNFVAFGAQCPIASPVAAIFSADNLYVRYLRTYNLDNVKASINTALHNIQIQKRTTKRLYVNEIETVLNNLPGVHDAYFNDPFTTFNGEREEPVDGAFSLNPGYFNFDPALYDFTKNKTIFEAV